jgi:hypothetical protein
VSVLQDCPRCGAMLRPDASWCSLCFARFDEPALTEPPAVVLDPATAAAWLDATPLGDEVGTPAPPVAEPFDPLTAPLEVLTAPQEAPAPAAAVRPPVPEPVGSDAVPEPQPALDPGLPVELPAVDGYSVDTMLTLLAAEQRQQDTLTTWADKMNDKPTRLLVMVGGIVVLSIGLFCALAVLSFLA